MLKPAKVQGNFVLIIHSW